MFKLRTLHGSDFARETAYPRVCLGGMCTVQPSLVHEVYGLLVAFCCGVEKVNFESELAFLLWGGLNAHFFMDNAT